MLGRVFRDQGCCIWLRRPEAETCQKAQRDQPFQVGRPCGGDAHNAKEDHRANDHSPAPNPIRDGACEDRAQGQAEKTSHQHRSEFGSRYVPVGDEGGSDKADRNDIKAVEDQDDQAHEQGLKLKPAHWPFIDESSDVDGIAYRHLAPPIYEERQFSLRM